MIKSIYFAVFLALVALASCELIKKRLAGPPSEFPDFKEPIPSQAAIEEKSAQYYVKFESSANKLGSGLSWSTVLPVDSDSVFAFGVFSPFQYKASLTDPDGNQIDLSKHIVQDSETAFPIGQGSVPGVVYVFNTPFVKGNYKLKIDSTSEKLSLKLKQLHASSEADGLVILYNESPVRAHTYLSTYDLKAGQQVGLVTMITADAEGTENPSALKDTIFSATMEVYDPTGHKTDVTMHDDGLHNDLEANDGIYGGSIDASETGIYRAEAFILGTHSDGTSFVRSTQHMLPVVQNELTLTGTARTGAKDHDRFDIFVSVSTGNSANANNQFRVYTELYGTDSNGNEVAVCWLGGMVDVMQIHNQQILTLEVNKNWLKMAGAKAPLTLKNTVVHDAYVHVPLSSLAEIHVQCEDAHLPIVTGPVQMQITKEMKEGKRRFNATANAAAPSLMLIHGYCSSTNPWQSGFTDASLFLEPQASLTNEKFAQLVVEHADELGMKSWGGVGHSQGGVVLVHILNYYESGLDESTGGRRIQSVGTPYYGNSGAGSAANLIKIFGYGCGENFDLTQDGSNLWMAGIRPESRKEVFYYTTTYKQGNLFGDYCNMAVNLVLQWPNDGTTEIKYTKLDSATNLGNVEKWCHTTDMAYPAQYDDVNRNKDMNSKASR